MGNFSIALSGLEANSVALNTIGNNLANLNTTAFKGQTTSFEDLFYQQIGRSGSGDPIQVGAGTKTSRTATDLSQGAILPDSDANAANMALAGDGFFMVQQNGQQLLTRAGDFQVARSGNLTTQGDQLVLGYAAAVDQRPQATRNFSVATNLDSTAAPLTQFSAQVTLVDSIGRSYLATIDFRKTPVPGLNAWDFDVSLPAGAETGWPTGNTGTIFFDAFGNPAASSGPPTSVTMTFPGLADGASTLSVTWNLNGLTSLPFGSIDISSTQDGNAGTKGAVNTNTDPVPIVLPVGSTEAAQATHTISATVNLNAKTSVGTTFTTPITVFDSLGQGHQATIVYDKRGTNTWNYEVTLPPGDASGMPVNNVGTLTFDSNGNLTSPTGSIAGISFPGMADGAADLTFSWDLNGGNSTPTVTQLASASSNNTVNQDGFASGNYTGFTVDASGVILAQFSNGQERTVAQIAVAAVPNTMGLVATGDNNFQVTVASGPAIAGIAGTGGRGKVDDNALEQSNVNIAKEFSNLIIAQRAFEANSKTMTTYDTISQDVMAMVR
jgi:flagellar hook-basal body protein